MFGNSLDCCRQRSTLIIKINCSDLGNCSFAMKLITRMARIGDVSDVCIFNYVNYISSKADYVSMMFLNLIVLVIKRNCIVKSKMKCTIMLCLSPCICMFILMCVYIYIYFLFSFQVLKLSVKLFIKMKLAL